MAWSLRIVHFDVNGAGDSTLFVATNTGDGSERSVLIDGGLKGAATHVYNGIVKYASGDLDVMVATHYDEDHLEGLTALLAMDCCEGLRVYDPGEVGAVTDKSVKRLNTPAVIDWTVTGRDNGYVNFLAAIDTARKAGSKINHLTALVMSDKDRAIPDNLKGTFHSSFALVGREIMWDTAGSLSDAATKPPDDAPTLTCIAANQIVLAGDGGMKQCARAANNFPRMQNARSLAFLLKFGDFRYYVGGDLESNQEDELLPYIKASRDGFHKLHAFKTSHHGSDYSTSAKFVKATSPAVAIISCSDDNKHGHPTQDVIGILEAGEVDYYLTGNGWGGLAVKGRGTIAGAPRRFGDISITLTEAEAAKADFNLVYLQPGKDGPTEETERYH